MKKRLLALIMVLSLALSLVPVSAAPIGTGEQNLIDKNGSMQSAEDSDGQVQHSKTIEQTGENKFDITLTVKTSQKIEEQVVSEDAAVVLVLDNSSSMDDDDISDLKEGVRSFVNTLTTGITSSAKREIAIVMFGSNANTILSWTDANTGWGKIQINQEIQSIHEKYDEGTNIEGGLRLAYNLLGTDDVKDITNKYVVLMTDGVPTYHVSDHNESSRTDVMWGTEGGGNSAEHEDYHDIYCTQDNPWNQGDQIPNKIKNERGARLYTVLYGEQDHKWVNGQTPSAWLSSFATQHFDEDENISLGLGNIADIIVNQAKAWILTDPMGSNILFDESNFDKNNIAEVNNQTQDSISNVRKYNTETNTLIWDLKNDQLFQKTIEGDTTWYTYTLTYSVTFNNLAQGVQANTPYATNGNTTLTYMLSDEDGHFTSSELYTTSLEVPKIHSLDATLQFTKVDEDNAPLKGATFTLSCTENGTTWTQEEESGADGTVTFSNVPSGHDYTLKETRAPADYILSTEQVTVPVNWGEVDYTNFAKDANDNNKAVFVNQADTGSLTISKTVNAAEGQTAPADAEFTFTVNFNGEDTLSGNFTYTQNEEEKIVQDGGTIILKANESVTITGIPVGTDYTVTETDPGNGFTSTATGETGTITAEGATAEFTNTYSATPATLNGATDLKVSKNISGRDWQEGDSFTFTLTGQNGAPMPSDVTGNTATVTIDADDAPNYTANFGDITYEVPGTYTYTVQETGEGSNGLTYDSTVYTVAVTVQDVDGALNVTNVGYTASDDDNFKYEDAGAMTFTNTYTTSTVTLTEGAITVEKILTGRDWKDADSFSFTLTAGENTANVTTPMPNPSTVNITTTASTKTEDGYAAGFGSITYDKAGTYSYTITENAVTADGITKDTATYSVEVTVSDDNAGTLTAEAVIKNGDNQAVDTATFTNTFTPATLGGSATDEDITITKNLTGRAWQEGDAFEFTIEGADELTNTAIAEGTVDLPDALTITHSSADVEEGLVASFFQNIADFFTGNDTVSYEKKGDFGTITFNEADTYTFLIKETANTSTNEGITYDRTSYKVTVNVVKDPTTNALTASIESVASKAAESDTWGDPEEYTDDSIVFTNAATASENTKSVQTGTEGDPDSVDPNGSIAGVGDILTYTIHWVNNAADDKGEMAPAKVTITDTIPAGTEYVANSATGENATIAYDDSNRTITWTINAAAGAQDDVTFKVKVTEDAVENENNEITNTATVGVNDVSYKVTSNPTYVPEKEDSVGEDGSIRVGQELTYTISYKNTEDTVATITITDVVPEGTEFVRADNGGDINNGTVTWTIENVQPDTAGTVTMTVKVVSAWEEEVENSASISIGGNNVNITVDTNTETTPIDEADRTITITPADITVYTGGDGYSSVIGSGSGEVGQDSIGLPEPGYYITLPAWLNETLDINDNPTDSEATDLSSLLKFTYTDENNSNNRNWPIELYYVDEDGTSYETETEIAGVPTARYIYKIVSDTSENNGGPVRVQFTEKGVENATPILSDDFTLDLDTLYQEYDMTIYPGLLKQQEVKAQVQEPGFEAATFDVKVDTGTLTVRGTTNGEEFTSVVTDEDQVNPEQNFAVVETDPETQYHVNDSMVSVNPEDVSLLADELVIGDDAEEAQNILKAHIVEEGIADADANYVYQYLDLVDTTNGNAWVTATEAVDVYWKLPASADANDNFQIVHFNGLNRNYDGDAAELIGTNGYAVETYTMNNSNQALDLEIVDVDGQNYLKFSTDSFSPFVLVYDSNDAANPSVTKTLSLVNGSAYNSGSVSVGDELTYTITVTNTGNLPLTGTTTVTESFSGVGALQFENSDDYKVVENTDGTYTITVENLAANASVTISATYIVQRGDAGTTLANTAVVRGPGDSDPTDEGKTETPVDPITPIRPPVDPDKPELNTEDHYAYIVGYPDGNVKPEGNITRAEVATIFFRLLTDESRDEFWSQTNPYSDVSEDDWYNNAVSTLTNAGIIDGYEDGTFKPNGNITRAEFATIAVRFFEATYEGENLFPDIDGHWAQDYINEAANAGIVDGYPDGTFGPQKLITRAEAMTMVNRTIDRHPHEDHLLADMIVWPDNPETAWYYEQVQEATNSHEYTMNTDDEQNPYEIWTELLPVRDWAQLEKEWSDAHSGQSGGDVV